MRPWVWCVVSCVFGSPLLAQPPAPPPPTILPAGATAAVSPLARFNDTTKYPAETLALVDAYRAASAWLGKVHQVHGRFLPGIDPALASKLESDSDAHQAVACLALCQAARMNPDALTTARANQSLLALFATRKIREAGPVGEKVVYAAAMALAVRELPGADAKLIAAGEQLVTFLKTAAAPDGTFPEQAGFPGSGLALQAVARSAAAAPESWKTDFLVKAAAGYRSALKTKPDVVASAAVLAGLADAVAVTKDPSLANLAFEFADAICTSQYGATDTTVPAKWVGGFRGPAEPGYEVAVVARGLAAATRLTRQVSTDLARYAKYKSATLNALAFVQSLQYTEDTTTHFDSKFRTLFLIGGVRTGPSSGVIRTEAAAWTALAVAAFLESGADARE